jgi:ferredoxin-NADP reductase
VSHAETVAVRVVAVDQVTAQVKRFSLAPVAGGLLPAFSGGSHIIVVMRGDTRTYRNPYSLMGSPAQLEHYEISVRRMDDSRGGSHYMHDEVQRGSVLQIAHPINLFALDKIARKHLLVAGGIGITPFIAQLADLRAGHVPYELHYAALAPELAAFREELLRQAPGRVRMYYRSAGERIAFESLLSGQPLGTHLYVCGGAAIIKNAVDAARAGGWPDSHIHWEQFSAPPPGEAFDVHLARSGKAVHVAPDQTLLESIEAAGVEVPYLCRGGVCGFCRTDVIDAVGELIHNDHFLSNEEKAYGRVIMPCVSRARCTRLVLDL